MYLARAVASSGVVNTSMLPPNWMSPLSRPVVSAGLMRVSLNWTLLVYSWGRPMRLLPSLFSVMTLVSFAVVIFAASWVMAVAAVGGVVVLAGAVVALAVVGAAAGALLLVGVLLAHPVRASRAAQDARVRVRRMRGVCQRRLIDRQRVAGSLHRVPG